MSADVTLLSAVALLLPVAAASGWFIGRRDAAGDRSSAPFPSEYFRGINYLLNEQHDKAIEVFIKVLEVDDEAVDTHLALGSLFRRRGEVDRAIRIHQNIIARPGLPPKQRARAMLELGLDYKRAGLFDRAEQLFTELDETALYSRDALRNLLEIHEEERDWRQALAMAERLDREQGEDTAALQAQFLCELANEALREGRENDAADLLKRAAKADPSCVRVSLMRAQLAIARRNYRNAIAYLKDVEQQNPVYLAETIEPLEVCYRALDRLPEFIDYLKNLARHHLGVTPVLTLAQLEQELSGREVAAAVIREDLASRPTVRGVDKLLEYWLDEPLGDARESYALLKDVTSRLLEQRYVYKCGACGFSGRTLHWQCPSCKRWDSVTPIRGLQGE